MLARLRDEQHARLLAIEEQKKADLAAGIVSGGKIVFKGASRNVYLTLSLT